jgi:hypothetical protein
MMSNIIPIDQVRTMATSAYKSGMFPLKNPEQAMTLMLVAQSEQIHPMKAMMSYDVIQGRPALKSSEILARFQDSGGKVEWIETNSNVAKGKFTHPQGGTITIEWNMDRATKAGYAAKDNWKKYPDQMMRARCVSEAVRAIYPRCLNNMYSVEEVAEMPQEEQEHIQEVEIIETPSTDTLKLELANKLKKEYNYDNTMIKAFATHYKLNENLVTLEEMVANDISQYVTAFENGE